MLLVEHGNEVLQTKVKPVSKPIAAVGGKSGWETELNNI